MRKVQLCLLLDENSLVLITLIIFFCRSTDFCRCALLGQANLLLQSLATAFRDEPFLSGEGGYLFLKNCLQAVVG